MLIRLFIKSYFLLFSLGIFLSKSLGEEYWKGLVFVFAGLYLLLRFIRKNIFDSSLYFDLLLFAIYSYVLLYSFLYFGRSSGYTVIIATTPILVIHLLFWHLVYTSNIYQNKPLLFFKDLYHSMLITFIVLFTYTWANNGYSFKPGSLHNMAEDLPLLYSDLDVPVLSLICLFMVLSQLSNLPNRFLKGKDIFRLLEFLILFILVIITQYLYSRRSHLAILIITMIFILLPLKFKKLSVILSFVIMPTIPLIWSLLSPYMIEYSKGEFINTLLTRNTIEAYVTASNRLKAWGNGFDYLFDYNQNHLFGYGYVPESISGMHNHMHNMYLTLFFEAGFITIFVVVSLLIYILYKLFQLATKNKSSRIIVNSLVLFFLSIIILSPIESLLMSYSTIHLIFITFLITSYNFLYHYKK